MHPRHRFFLSSAAPSLSAAPGRRPIRAAARHEEVESPLALVARPGNLNTTGEGAQRLALGTRWTAMLGALAELGELLVITRNEHAVIARAMPYPALIFDAEGWQAHDERREFDLDLRGWHSACALHERSRRGNIFRIEFRNQRRQAFHSLVLRPESNLVAFARWLDVYQRDGAAESGPLAEARPDAALAAVPEEQRELPVAALQPMLQEAVARQISIRAVTGHDSMVQGHGFRPRQMCVHGSWVFCSSDQAALHFDQQGIGRVLLHDTRFHGECWALKACARDDGRLLFVLAPACCHHLAAWNQLVRQFAL